MFFCLPFLLVYPIIPIYGEKSTTVAKNIATFLRKYEKPRENMKDCALGKPDCRGIERIYVSP